MKATGFVLTLSVLAASAGCSGTDQLPLVPDPTAKVDSTPKTPLELLDLSRVPPLDPKGRFQDGRTGNGEPNPIAKDLVANGKDSIPFLIAKLDNEAEIDPHIINYWYRLFEGDLALIILMDFFTDETEVNSTVPGFSYDDFLERGSDRTLTGEEVLRR